MLDKIQNSIRRLGHRYLIVGISVYLLELLVIVISQRLGASAVVAVSLSFWTGLIVSFGLQKVVTFNDRRAHPKILRRQIFAYSTLVLFNFGFTLIVTKLLAPPLSAVATRTIALIITTLWNFYLFKTHIFLKPENNIY